MRSTSQLTAVRCAILLALLGFIVPAIMVPAMAAGLPAALAGLITAGVCLIAGRGIARHLPVTPAGSGVARRTLPLLWLALGLFAVYRIASLSVFMYDVERSEYGLNPTIRQLDDAELAKPFFPKHDCFTCYIVGAHVAGTRVDNMYDKKYYRDAEVKTPIHEEIGESLSVDSYQYPPPFLLLPRLLLVTGGDFYQLRAYWFGLNIIVVVATLVTLLLWVDGPRITARWLIIPILFVSPVMVGTLQIQNAHLLIITISLLSLPAFDKRRDWFGGALLGFAIVSKLFPGLLLVFLLIRRRWRAVCWTGGWMIAYVVTTMLVFGAQPFKAFLSYQMSRLASGEAFFFATTYIAPLVKNGVTVHGFSDARSR